MQLLLYVLYANIFITVLFWALPLLLAPGVIVGRLPSARLVARLAGAAHLSLCVGYTYAILLVQRDIFADGIILMALVSNALAALIIFLSGITGAFQGLPPRLKSYLWLSLLLLGPLTGGLAYALLQVLQTT